MKPEYYPLIFEPVYRDYVWGGSKIARRYRRENMAGKCAESWEISDRSDGMSIVASGPMKGRTLHELVQEWGPNLLGLGRRDKNFPLLLKIIDARECLSIQVHPNDKGAAQHGGEAKTEMWYALDAEPGARVFAGLEKGVTPDQFRAAIRDNTVPSHVRAVPMSRGTAVYVPGGRVHAIDAGCLLLEVQQNSNTTYRIYDWGRPRPLHVEQAMKVIHWDDDREPRVDPADFLCPYFQFRRHPLERTREFRSDGRSFQILFVEDGPVQIAWAGGFGEYSAGTSILLPAALQEWSVAPVAGTAAILQINLP